VALAAGCGRIGFDGGSDAATGRDDAATDADASAACVGGDMVCRVSCLAVDPDCVTTCGDGICVGNAEELCTTCADCVTLDPVCGNGACDPGEDSDICYADCGPSPWPWTAQEAELLVLVNNARAAGITCPAMGMVTGPALTVNAAFGPAAREWAWEIAHQGYQGSGGCNGRTGADRINAIGATANVGSWTGSTPQAALDTWLVDAVTCPIVADPTYTRVGVGVAHDAMNGFAMFLDP
jgi:hypothetical protein